MAPDHIDPAALADLVEQAWAWAAADPDPTTRDELASLIAAAEAGDAAAAADLAERFAGELAFGTAGLRGELGAGPNRMNLAVVTRAANGIVSWLRDHGGPGAAQRGVVVCFDARHRSRDFAEASAAIFATAGVRALVLPGPLPTPVLAFAVGHLGAAAGVMVTASHNPRADNGYKVYESSGRQIVPPDDALIAAGIAATGRACDVPYADAADPDIVRVGPELVDAYVAGAGSVGLVPEARDLRVAYTALHGVGAATFRRAWAAAGFAPAVEVAEQIDPDPAFPTTPFPNPEEPGVLDLGIALASSTGADLLVANDPDADRLGVALPDPAVVGGWRVLRGDEIGVILAHHLLAHGGVEPGAVFATTIVSSTLLSKVAAAAGVAFVETLTGFKWVSRAAGPGGHLALGYEEALGFCVGDLVHDKDGISAAVLFAEAVAVQRAAGRSVFDVLDDLALAHGVHATSQWSARVDGATAMDELTGVMARLRAAPPTELAGRPVTSVDDLLAGDGSHGFAPSDLLIFGLDGARVVVRPSGTEPKLKAYIEVVVPVAGAAGGLAAARDEAAATLDAVQAAVAELTGLGGS